MLKGVLIKESLTHEGVLKELSVTKTETVKIDNAVEGQPSTWTLGYFEVAEGDAQKIAKNLSFALKSGKWYVDFKSEKEVYVVFAGKIFHYQRGDETGKRAAVEYGHSLGIPESQLDW